MFPPCLTFCLTFLLSFHIHLTRTREIFNYYENPYKNLKKAESSTDYYWRNFDDEIPLDALQGGNYDDDLVSYVGLVLSSKRNSEVVGNVHPNSREIRACTKTECFSEKIFIKILCTQKKHKMQWVPVSDNIFRRKIHFVTGGFENGKILKVGRGINRNHVVVGNVVESGRNTRMLRIPNKYNKPQEVHDFEVLVYNTTTLY